MAEKMSFEKIHKSEKELTLDDALNDIESIKQEDMENRASEIEISPIDAFQSIGKTESKYKKAWVNFKKDRVIKKYFSEDDFLFIGRFSAFKHFLGPLIKQEIEDLLDKTSFLKYFDSENGILYLSYAIETGKFERIKESDIEKEKVFLERLKKIVDSKISLLREKKEIKKIKESESKTYEDVESDAEPETSWLRNIDRRSQGIKKR